MALDYAGIHSALRDLLAAVDYSSLFTAANRITKVNVYEEAIEAEQTLAHMPFINVILVSSAPDLTSIPNGYYEQITFEVTIAAFDFTSFKEAARLRDGLLSKVVNAIMGARAFHSDLNTSTLGTQIDFGVASPQGAGGHVALATLKVVCEGYNEPS